MDIAVPTGTNVYATHDGTVTQAAYDSHYGNYVVLELDGYTTKYAHMETVSVSTGQTVEKGTIIGTTGNTGNSTGSHLHIECLYNGEYYNPLFYFDVGTGTIYGEAIDRDPTDVRKRDCKSPGITGFFTGKVKGLGRTETHGRKSRKD